MPNRKDLISDHLLKMRGNLKGFKEGPGMSEMEKKTGKKKKGADDSLGDVVEIGNRKTDEERLKYLRKEIGSLSPKQKQKLMSMKM